MNAPLVIGLDLSVTATGIAAHDGTTSTVRSRRDGDHRLTDIAETVHRTIHLDRPVDLVVVEDLPTHAHGAGITGMVHGAVRVVLLDAGTPYVVVPPASVKKYATGKGNATKPDMRMALYRRAGIDERDDNRVDAWWLRAMGLDALGAAPLVLPAGHREALAKVAWPRQAAA